MPDTLLRPSSAASVLRAAITARPRDFALAGVLYSTHQLGEALVPVLVGAAIAHGVATGLAAALGLWLLALAADFALLSLSYRFGARAAARAKQQAGHDLRLALVTRTLRPSGGADLAPGELLSRASSDADRVGALVGMIASGVAAAVAVTAACVFLLVASPLLGVLIVLGAVLQLGATTFLSRRVAVRAGIEQQAAAEATHRAADLVRGLRTLAGLGAGAAAADRYRATSRTAVHAAERAVNAEAEIDGISALLAGIYLALVAAAAGWLALTGALGLGTLVSVLGLAVFLTGPLGTLTVLPASVQRASASARRLAEVLRRPAAVAEGDAALPTGRSLTIDTAGGLVVAEEGRLTGIVCTDPADASRIVAALAREGDTGPAVRLDGILATELPLEAYRSAVVVAPHDAAVFDATLAENLEPGLPVGTAPSPGALRAASAAYADEFADALPGGRLAPAGEAGRRLSGGQRQRLALARALATAAPILVLHEPLTAVDPATADIVAERMRALRAGRTTIMVSASPALLSRCDAVVLVDGDRTVRGLHEHLCAQDGGYRGMVSR